MSQDPLSDEIQSQNLKKTWDVAKFFNRLIVRVLGASYMEVVLQSEAMATAVTI